MSTVYNNLWWAIPGVLAGMGMPYIDSQRRLDLGGSLNDYTDDLPLLYHAGIRAFVCLLNIPSDEQIFQKAGFAYKCFPVDNGCAPDLLQTKEFIDIISQNRISKRPVAVSCEAGLGRTGTMIATYLIHEGLSASAAIEQVKSMEPAAIETPRQIKFLEDFEGTKQRKKLL
jgi:atypical dual specificity phosphatase